MDVFCCGSGSIGLYLGNSWSSDSCIFEHEEVFETLLVLPTVSCMLHNTCMYTKNMEEMMKKTTWWMERRQASALEFEREDASWRVWR